MKGPGLNRSRTADRAARGGTTFGYGSSLRPPRAGYPSGAAPPVTGECSTLAGRVLTSVWSQEGVNGGC